MTPERPSANTRTLALIGALLIALALFAATLAAQPEPRSGPVMLGRLEAPIDPISARVLEGWLRDADAEGASVFILEIDTPGGSFDSTRDMVGYILDSPVPVVAFVTPAAARAASAGSFIVASAHLAAMSPGTNIGAASPVTPTGEDLPETLREKVTQDAAALLRSVATQRNRNSDALVDTITEAASYSVEEALELDIIDVSANDARDLLGKIDGLSVTIAGVDETLSTAGATIQRVEASPVQKFLRTVSNPQLVFIMLAAGGVLLLVEIVSPGGWVAGVAGAALLTLAFLGLVNLPVNWVGLILIAAGLALFFWEMQAPGWGGFGAAGMIAFVIGGFLLFGDTGVPGLPAPDVKVGFGVLGATAAVMAVSLFGLWHFSRKARNIRVVSRKSQIVGQTGVVRTALSPKGTVQAAGELWTAESESGETIDSGENVVVSEVNGITLVVYRESPT